MTKIDDLQERVNSAEKIFDAFKSELDELKAELEALKNQEPEQESLLGCWATHKEYGRGVIFSSEPNDDGYVRIAYRNDSCMGGAETCYARPEDLDLDPAILTTGQDFEDAPEGTIIEELGGEESVHVKGNSKWWEAGTSIGWVSDEVAPSRVIRWGNGQ